MKLSIRKNIDESEAANERELEFYLEENGEGVIYLMCRDILTGNTASIICIRPDGSLSAYRAARLRFFLNGGGEVGFSQNVGNFK
jgi:hypothetical protein